MIKIFLFALLSLYIGNGVCGVSVIGTRFMINDKAQKLNIKIVNDNESDYLIKSTLDDKDFVISPPLFLLEKNSSNMITVIPKERKNYGKDKLINLTVTAIPKSTINDDVNSISMAVRNHFKIIYRHKILQRSSFDKFNLSSENNKCQVINNSDFSFTFSVSKEKNSRPKIMNIGPSEKFLLDRIDLEPPCKGWVLFYNEFNDVINTVMFPKLQ